MYMYIDVDKYKGGCKCIYNKYNSYFICTGLSKTHELFIVNIPQIHNETDVNFKRFLVSF